MRFAHLSDSHLGTRQFGLMERETDFYEVFAKTIDKIIEKDVDFVIHSGDLFDNNRPSTEALLAFQNALLRLNEEKINIYAIAGNHDSILRKGAMPPLVLFKNLGLKLISHNNPAYNEGPVLICGLPYVASSQGLVLKEKYDKLSGLADKYLKSILVSHQGIDKWMHEDTHEIELSQMPRNFDYYAMGHIHNYIEEDFGKGKLVYPGSMEIWRTSENNDNYREFGKGFVVVDLSYDKPEIERVKIDLPREFYNEIIDYDKFYERLSIIKEKIESLPNKPMLDLTVAGGDFESAEVYEAIKEALGDSVLNLRPSFKPDKVLYEEEKINPDNILDPRTLLHMKVNDKYGKDAGNLSLNLLDNLSIGRVDDAKIISDRYYSDHYDAKNDDSDLNQNKIDESDDMNESNNLEDYLDNNLDDAGEVIDDEASSKSKQMSFDDF